MYCLLQRRAINEMTYKRTSFGSFLPAEFLLISFQDSYDTPVLIGSEYLRSLQDLRIDLSVLFFRPWLSRSFTLIDSLA
jgi:hypothetical protein